MVDSVFVGHGEAIPFRSRNFKVVTDRPTPVPKTDRLFLLNEYRDEQKTAAFEKRHSKYAAKTFVFDFYKLRRTRVSEQEERLLQKHQEIMHDLPLHARPFYVFIRDKMLPMLEKGGGIFIKHVQHAGGNIIRVFVRNGFVFLQTTNKSIETRLSALENKESAKRALSENSAGAAIKLAERLARYGNAPRTICLGRLRGFKGRRLADFSQTILETVMGREGNRQLLLQREINYAKLRRRPLEFRFFLQPGDNEMKVVHHYAQVGANPFTVNYSVGTRVLDTRKALLRVLKRAFPEKSKSHHAEMAVRFISEATALAEDIVNRWHYPRILVTRVQDENYLYKNVKGSVPIHLA